MKEKYLDYERTKFSQNQAKCEIFTSSRLNQFYLLLYDVLHSHSRGCLGNINKEKPFVSGAKS